MCLLVVRATGGFQKAVADRGANHPDKNSRRRRVAREDMVVVEPVRSADAFVVSQLIQLNQIQSTVQ